MSICLYTISDFKDRAIDCIRLLLSSIIFDQKIDFYIISNVDSNNYEYNVILDNSIKTEYIGYLKYSKLLPNNYDYYIYLDSDILYFDKISKLINKDKKFTIVRSGEKIGRNLWYLYRNCPLQQLNNLKNTQALNAGTFCFHNSQLYLLHEIYDLYNQDNLNNLGDDIILEQSLFNYVLHRTFDYKLNSYFDITNIVQLFASDAYVSYNKTLYHFCGYTNEMQSKFHTMKKFYDNYPKSLMYLCQ